MKEDIITYRMMEVQELFTVEIYYAKKKNMA